MTNKRFFQGVLGFGCLLLISCQLINLEEAKTENIYQLPSIAVLPFEDMSSDKSQTYFGDGIAEEILNTLVNLKALNVAGRTSSFSFKNQEATIEEKFPKEHRSDPVKSMVTRLMAKFFCSQQKLVAF